MPKSYDMVLFSRFWYNFYVYVRCEKEESAEYMMLKNINGQKLIDLKIMALDKLLRYEQELHRFKCQI